MRSSRSRPARRSPTTQCYARQGVRGPDDLPLFKPPYSRITAIDMNTGEHLWWVPVGETPNRIKNHPKLKGIDVGETGTGRVATDDGDADTLLIYQGEAAMARRICSRSTRRPARRSARSKVDGVTRYGMMTYVHEGHQYVMLQTGPKLTAMALPKESRLDCLGNRVCGVDGNACRRRRSPPPVRRVSR